MIISAKLQPNLKCNFIVPMRIDCHELLSNPVVFSDPKNVKNSEARMFVGSLITLKTFNWT
jgi:hypothetical protein